MQVVSGTMGKEEVSSEKAAYYDILEQTQKVGLDIAAWLTWFLNWPILLTRS
jgi:Fic family protein